MNKKGFTLIELLVVIVIITILAVILLPALAPRPPRGSRASCANNLKQWGIVFKMYSGENKGSFPYNNWHIVAPHDILMSFDAKGLYPDYWTDPSIAICPNDPRVDAAWSPTGRWGGKPLPALPEKDLNDYMEMLSQYPQGVTKAGITAKDACITTVLSWPYSYIYCAWATTSTNQLGIIYYFFGINRLLDALDPGHAWDNVSFTNAEIVEVGCPSNWQGINVFTSKGYGKVDLTRSAFEKGGYTWAPELNGSLPPNTLHLLKEGVEKLFITDIKNPAAGAMAQSIIPVMWDAWGNPASSWSTDGFNTSAKGTIFNHMPGGSNVLFMDGHVEFIKYGTKYPVWSENTDFGRAWSSINFFVGGAG